MLASAGGVNSSRVTRSGRSCFDGSHVTGLEVEGLVDVRVEDTHYRGVPSPRGHGSRSEELRRDEHQLGGDYDDSRSGEPPAPRDERADGHDPRR